MPSSIHAVLFDAFNTLWRPARPLVDMWADVLAQFGAVRAGSDIMSAVAEHQPSLERRALTFETSGRPVDDDTIAALWTKFDRQVLRSLGIEVLDEQVASNVFPIFADFGSLYDDAVEVLASVRTMGYRMAIVSNGVHQQRVAARLGIAGYFDIIIGSWHVGCKKPGPDIFNMALGELGVSAEQTLMVGDSWGDDVEGATAIGIRALHLKRGETVDESRGEISSLHGVNDFLGRRKLQARKK